MSALKNLLQEDYLKIVDSFTAKLKSNDEILNELVNSINELDFKILAFPEIDKLNQRLVEIHKMAKIQALKWKLIVSKKNCKLLS
jgi:hypothetical protein